MNLIKPGPCLAIIGLLASVQLFANKLQHPVPLAFSRTAEGTAFSAFGREHSIHVSNNGAHVILRNTILPIHVQGASTKVRPEAIEQLPGKVNFYQGQDRAKWRAGLDTFAKVALRGVRPGVDVVYYGNERRLEYDLELAPGIDPRGIAMEVGEGWKASITKAGALRIADGKGAEVEFAPPVSYQTDVKGARVPVESAYLLKDARHFGFKVGAYDRSRKLVIDPTIVFGSFLGGNGIDEAFAVTTDSSGNIYVTGRTYSGDFPMTVGSRCVVNSSNLCYTADPNLLNTLTYYAFVTKFNPQGTQVLYSTYLGGNLGTRLDIVNNGTSGNAIVVDASGNAYVGGATFALNFPVLNALQSARGKVKKCLVSGQPLVDKPVDQSDAFLTKLNSSGSLVFSTYFGGSFNTAISGLALSGSDVWATGTTYGVGGARACDFNHAEAWFGPFPVGIADQAANGLLYGEDRNPANVNQMVAREWTAFVAKFSSSGTLGYGAYVGRHCLTGETATCSGGVYGSRIAADSSGNLLLGGKVNRSGFNTGLNGCSPGQTCFDDAWVLKMTPGGSQSWVRVLGANGNDWVTGLGVDSDGNAFAAGNTQSVNTPGSQLFPTTPGAYQTSNPNQTCGWVAKLSSSAGSTLNSTLFCQPGSSMVFDLAMDASTKTPVITGDAQAIPFVNPVGTLGDAYLTQFNADLSGLLFSTYVAASGNAAAVTVGSSRNAVVVGKAQSFTGVATTGAYDTTYNGGNYDAFVTSINLNPAPPVLSTLSTSPNPLVGGQAFTLTINGSGFDPGSVEVLIGSTVIANASITTKTATQLVLTTTQAAGTYNVTARNGSAGTASNALSLTVNASNAAPVISSLSPNPATAGSVTLTINGSNFNTGTVQVEIGGGVIGNASITTKTATQLVLTTTLQGGTYSVLARNGSGATASNTVSLTVNGVISGQGSHFVPVSPCRTIDTRTPGAGGVIPRDSSRNFAFSNCGVPSNATAVAMNITLVPTGPFGYLAVWPAGQPQPVVSTMNSLDGRIKANAAIVGLGVGGAASIYVTDAAHVILDVNGYFVPVGTPGALAFYPATPCRVIDTRNPGAGGIIAAQATRIVSGGCLPASAQAYSLNVTVVPPAPLGFLSLWPVGQSQPTVSTLNNLTGTVVANAAILRSGTSGAFNAYVTEQSHFIADLNGYFATPGQPGALAFYPSTPCRIFDTRGANGAFGGPAMAADASRNFTVPSSACNIPTTAQAYVTNATVVPSGVFGFLTLWPAGQTRPTVSTLNAVDGALTSNAAIVPAGSGGAISVYTSNGTHLLLDISGYFAP